MQKSSLIRIEGESATLDEALEVSGLGQEIKAEELYNGDMKPVKGYKRVYMGDETLCVTKSSYNIVQNREAFEIIEDVMVKSNCQISTIGYDRSGARTFIQAKMPHSLKVLRGDELDQYLTISTTHDGTGSIKASFTGVRMACTNQMNMIRTKAHKAAKRSIAIQHSSKSHQRLEVAAQMLMEGSETWKVIQEQAKILTRKNINREQTIKFLEAMFPMPKEETGKRLVDKATPKREKVLELIETGKGSNIEGVKGTAWGLFNAYTEYYDHHRTVNSGSSRYLKSFTNGDSSRTKAYETLMAL